MKAVILTTAANLAPSTVARLTTDLGLSLGRDSLIVVSAHPSREHVPATTHLWLRWGSFDAVRRPVLPIEAPVIEDEDEDAREESTAQVVAALPPHHPRRIAHGVKWRSRKLRRELKARRSGRPRRLPRIPLAAVRSDVSSVGFMQACLRAPSVRRAVQSADVVLAHDPATHRAGWVLSRLYPQPAVVIDVTAARRAVELRRSEG